MIEKCLTFNKKIVLYYVQAHFIKHLRNKVIKYIYVETTKFLRIFNLK